MSRRRFKYDQELGKVVEIGADWSDAETRAPVGTEELIYGGAGRSTDGADISSRKKHREYLKSTGAAMHSDYKETIQKRNAERMATAMGERDVSERKRDVYNSIQAVKRGHKWR